MTDLYEWNDSEYNHCKLFVSNVNMVAWRVQLVREHQRRTMADIDNDLNSNDTVNDNVSDVSFDVVDRYRTMKSKVKFFSEIDFFFSLSLT